MITVGEKIQEFVDYLGYTKLEIFHATGIPPEDITWVLKGSRLLTEKEIETFSYILVVPVKSLKNGISIGRREESHTPDEIEVQMFQDYLNERHAA